MSLLPKNVLQIQNNCLYFICKNKNVFLAFPFISNCNWVKKLVKKIRWFKNHFPNETIDSHINEPRQNKYQ